MQIEVLQIGAIGDNVFAQLHSINRLFTGEVFIRWPSEMFIPDTVAHNIENDALEAVIIVHGPPDAGIARHLWHDLFGKDEIAADEVSSAALGRIHAATFLVQSLIK